MLNLTTGRGLHGDSVDALVGIENLLGGAFNDALSGDAAANDLYGGRGADNLNGLGGNDRVYGQDGDDLVFGQAGNDLLEGGAGNDTLDGGEGINVLRGGSGVDTVDYGSLGAGIEVDLAFRGTNMSGNGRFESLAEIEVIRATNSRDTLVGDAFGNQFFGRAGNDTIDGGEGDDILSGGAGADVFHFEAAPAHFLAAVDSGFDRITDFVARRGRPDRPALAPGGDRLRRAPRRRAADRRRHPDPARRGRDRDRGHGRSRPLRRDVPALTQARTPSGVRSPVPCLRSAMPCGAPP